MDEEKKIWAWHDAPNSIYAYTDDNSIKNLFEEERRLKPFKRKSYYMTEEEFTKFKRTWTGCKLCKIQIYDGKEYLDFIATEREEYELDEECNNIADEIHTTLFHLDEIPFKKKYKKLIEEVTVDIYTELDGLPFVDKNTMELLNLDEFSIFCKKYGHTIF